ncbi:hypothetical protein AAVH_20738 [Aphelenchoides avenae]|nr:hypothetical protein AAVH_20738 [Aphelenchus avenae]
MEERLYGDFIKKTPVGTKWTEETVMQKKRVTLVGEERVAIEYKLTQRFSLKVKRIQAGRCEGAFFYLAVMAIALMSAAITILMLA